MAWDWGVLKTCGDHEKHARDDKTPIVEENPWQESSLPGDLLSPPPISAPIPSIVIHPVPSVQTSVFSLNAPLGGMLFSYAVSALFVCLAMLVGWTWKVSESELIAANKPQVQKAAFSPLSPKMAIVGRITGMIQCKFSDDKDILPPPGDNAFVPLGRKYKLDSGLMQIAYDTARRSSCKARRRSRSSRPQAAISRSAG